jgi:SAM-dependent methyltransferase
MTPSKRRPRPWRRPGGIPPLWTQSFPFSCGPAALGSVLTALGWVTPRSRPREELALWREVTAVACPGAHPLGLALAARRRGFSTEVRIDGSRPWLGEHVRSAHDLLPPREYARVERLLGREGRELGIPVRRGPGGPGPTESGLLLVTAHEGPTTPADPHWIGLLSTREGLWVTDPRRSRPYRSARSLPEWWAVSGFGDTRSWVGIRSERLRPEAESRPRSPVAPGSRDPLPRRSSGQPRRPEPLLPVPLPGLASARARGPADALPRTAWSRAEALKLLEPPSRRREQNPELLWRRVRLAPGETLVEVGAGTGYFALPAARRVGPGGRVYAVDLSAELVELLRERKGREGLPQLTPVRSTVTSIPLPTGVADVVLLANVLHDLPLSTVTEAVRLLKPAGRFAIVDWRPSGGPGGPPRSIRLSPARAARLLARHGLVAEDRWGFGRSHYGLTLRRRSKVGPGRVHDGTRE